MQQSMDTPARASDWLNRLAAHSKPSRSPSGATSCQPINDNYQRQLHLPPTEGQPWTVLPRREAITSCWCGRSGLAATLGPEADGTVSSVSETVVGLVSSCSLAREPLRSSCKRNLQGVSAGGITGSRVLSDATDAR
jgi:hypothetical protein